MSERTLTPLQLQTYAQQLRLEEKSPATVEKYLRDLHAFSVWADGREINKELTAEWKAHLVEENYAPASVNAMLSALKACWSTWDWIPARSNSSSSSGGCSRTRTGN